MGKAIKFICLPFVFILITACTPQSQTVMPLPTVTSTTEILPSPTSPSPTFPAPSSTPVLPSPTFTSPPPTVTQTPGPASLNPDGPYVLYFGPGGTWISNPDGTFVTRISDYEQTNSLDMHGNLSPQGDRLALVTSNTQGLDLVLVSIPGGQAETIAHLIDSPPPGAYDPTSANSFATMAIHDFDSIAWQPGAGRLLAFIGATKGPTADLYLYDTQTKQVTQLTDGPSQAISPTWSPDGQYILHYGVSWVPPFGGAIVGPNRFDGVWAVRASDGKLITLPKNQGDRPYFVGWQDNTHYITYDPGECSDANLRSVDVTSGKATPLMQASFYSYIARSPENGNILFSSAEECPGSLGEGIFLLPYGQTTPIKLFDKRAWEIDWMPESALFDAYPERLFSADGKTSYESPVYDQSFKPAVSKLGYQTWVVYENYVGRVMVRVPGGDWQTILKDTSGELIWDPLVGNTLLIAGEDGNLYAATYPDFTPRILANITGGVSQMIWSP